MLSDGPGVVYSVRGARGRSLANCKNGIILTNRPCSRRHSEVRMVHAPAHPACNAESFDSELGGAGAKSK